MKKNISKILFVLIILGVILYTPAGVITGLRAENVADNTGYLENVLLEKMPGRERLNLVVSQQPLIDPPSLLGDNSLLIKLGNLYAPDSVREALRDMRSDNLIGAQLQQRTEQGKQWVYLQINLKQIVPYSIRQDGKIIVIDFNVSGIEAKLSAADSAKGRGVAFGGAQGNKDPQALSETAKQYTERMVSVDFQDAEIKSVLRLMAEYGNISIISGDDVKGNVTLAIKNVPWNQAFQSILDVRGLVQSQSGNIIIVATLEKHKKDEADKRKAMEEMRKADDERKTREQALDIEKGNLRQIMIEAKIIEASEDFIRNLGIQWGGGNSQNISGTYGLGIAGATNPLTTTRQMSQAFPPEITPAMVGMAAVNLPSNVIGPTLGLVFGNSRGFIEAQLSALEKTTQGKIISSPRVVTMDNVEAVIKQGEEVPYVTPATTSAPPTIAFKDALLSLKVKPKITSDNRISMVIKASNDRADYSKANVAGENPPIVKNEVDSKVVVRDGDTVVIGGISKNDETKIVAGVPWFYKIPVLGWLFKTENVDIKKRQLLIFVTPKILSESGYIEDECNMNNSHLLDRCRKSQ